MPKLTKTQKKRLVKSIKDKAAKLYLADIPAIMSMKEYDAIATICDRVMKKIQ